MKSHGSDFMMVSNDFNDIWLSWTDNHFGSDLGLNLFNLSTVCNITQLINEPTRYTNNSASVLDLIFVDNAHFVKYYGVNPQGLAVIFSHHRMCIKKKKGGHFLGGQKWK